MFSVSRQWVQFITSPVLSASPIKFLLLIIFSNQACQRTLSHADVQEYTVSIIHNLFNAHNPYWVHHNEGVARLFNAVHLGQILMPGVDYAIKSFCNLIIEFLDEDEKTV